MGTLATEEAPRGRNINTNWTLNSAFDLLHIIYFHFTLKKKIFFFLFRPPFTAFNQKELAGKIREGKFRRIPYRYSDELNDIITRMLNLKDYHRPSVEEILENPLIAGLVAEEQRINAERRGRRSGEPEKLQDPSPVSRELRLKEAQLQEREAALKAREERLERKSGGTKPSAPRG